MAKLVVLSEGFAGQTYELKTDRTTIGRVEDNTFAIVDGSVSSHHCEVHRQGDDQFLVKDLGSTNGTFIDGEQIEEGVLKPGQILRVGHIDVRLEKDRSAGESPKQLDQTTVIQQGVRAENLNRGPAAFDPSSSQFFKKKSNKANKTFLVVGIVLGAAIVLLVGFAIFKLTQ